MNRASFWPMVRLTCTEIPRQPAVLLLTTTLICFTGALPFLITHNLGEPGKLVRDCSLAMIFLGSLLLAVPAACHAVSTEIRSGTAGAILSKPISRIRFLFAKYLGVSIIMLSFSLMATLTLLISDRAASRPFQVGWNYLLPLFTAVLLAYLLAALLNFTRSRPFSSTAFWCLIPALAIAFLFTLADPGTAAENVIGHGEHTHHIPGEAVPVRWALLPACLCLTFAALMFQALALLFALRLGVVPTLSVCTGFFLLGLMSDYLLVRRAADALWARGLYLVLPNWQHFWMADALTSDGSVPWAYVGDAAGYALTWSAGILLLAVARFERMEMR